MIEYKGYQFGRADKYNLHLFQVQKKEVTEGGGRGKGRPKGTGKFEDRLVFVGFYSTIGAVLFKIMQLELENVEVKSILDKMDEFKNFVDGIIAKLPIEEMPDAKEDEELVEVVEE